MEHQQIDLPEGYLTVRVPGGTVVISAGLIDVQTKDPVVVVEVSSQYEASPDSNGLLWRVDGPRPYGKPGEITMRSRKPNVGKGDV